MAPGNPQLGGGPPLPESTVRRAPSWVLQVVLLHQPGQGATGFEGCMEDTQLDLREIFTQPTSAESGDGQPPELARLPSPQTPISRSSPTRSQPSPPPPSRSSRTGRDPGAHSVGGFHLSLGQPEHRRGVCVCPSPCPLPALLGPLTPWGGSGATHPCLHTHTPHAQVTLSPGTWKAPVPHTPLALAQQIGALGEPPCTTEPLERK